MKLVCLPRPRKDEESLGRRINPSPSTVKETVRVRGLQIGNSGVQGRDTHGHPQGHCGCGVTENEETLRLAAWRDGGEGLSEVVLVRSF